MFIGYALKEYFKTIRKYHVGKYSEWYLADVLEQQPTVDAVPVRHGKWIHEVRYTIDSLHSYQQYRCSKCGMTYITNTKYCPECGAKMTGIERLPEPPEEET